MDENPVADGDTLAIELSGNDTIVLLKANDSRIKILDLGLESHSQEQIDAAVESLLRNRNVKHLNLFVGGMMRYQINSLVQSLGVNMGIESIDVNTESADIHLQCYLIEKLLQASTFGRLLCPTYHFKSLYIQVQDVKVAAMLQQYLTGNTHLEELEVFANEECMGSIVKGLKLSSVRRLSYISESGNTRMDALLDLLTTYRNFQVLELYVSNLLEAHLLQLQHFQNLRRVAVHYQAANCFPRFIHLALIPQLEEFECSFPQLLSLVASFRVALGLLECPALRCLKIDANSRFLERPGDLLYRLESFTLSDQDGGDAEIDFDGKLRNSESIRRLEVDVSMSDGGWESLLECIRSLPNLEELSLSRLPESVVLSLSELLEDRPQIKAISLSDDFDRALANRVYFLVKLNSIGIRSLLQPHHLPLYPQAIAKLCSGSWLNVVYHLVRERSDLLIQR